MTLVARFQSRALHREIAVRAPAYASLPPETQRRVQQLELLNRCWAEVSRDVPHYRDLRETGGLPDAFGSLEEFVECVPASDRSTLQTRGDSLISRKRPPELWAATGGSTASPIQLPRWKQELLETRPNMWIGRSWYGVEPDDRLFLLWGHSHLLGTGWRGFLNARQRQLFDWLLGYHRFSAYDISDAAMQRAVQAILAFRPAYVLGYSVALDRLADAALDAGAALEALGIKTVIATAEGFPSPDSAARIERAFGCPVSMEYGAVEALGVAYTHPEGGYRLFWQSYLAEAERRGERWLLRLTSLYPRSLPLLRYEIGDEVELGPDAPDRVVGLAAFERVAGRCNDYVEMADGQLIHSEAISHAVRPCPAVRSYQLVQQGSDIRLHYTSRNGLPADQEAGLRQRLRAIHPGLGDIPVESKAALARSIAGKTPMVLRR